MMSLEPPSKPPVTEFRSTKATAFRCLVCIQPGRGGTPFFCVHGAGGNILNFADIARRLGKDQAFFGLQAHGVDGGKPLESIEEMAEAYLAELRSVQPRGPYYIGGYSSGGVVAFEMAQRLKAAGETVALTVLLDSFGPSIRPRQTLREHAANLASEGPAYVSRRLQTRAREWATGVATRLKVRFYESQGKPLPFELRAGRMRSAFLAAASRYHGEAYDGRVVLYRATYMTPQFRHAGVKQGWESLAPRLEVVDVPGNHDSLVLEPNVSVVTAHLRALLRSVPREGARSE